jgi:hypothetical protein
MLPDSNGFGWAVVINKDDGQEARLEASLVEVLLLLMMMMCFLRGG